MEAVLHTGKYIFDSEDFASELLKNIGITEFVRQERILEKKSHIHHDILTGLGFRETEQDVWAKGIFLISLLPPKWEDDRGKVLILKKPNIKKLKKADRAASVAYKGRYFFDDAVFTEALLTKIGFFLFDNDPKQKNMDYEFVRDGMSDQEGLLLDRALLSF